MKKKIKYLTLEECQRICETQSSCSHCPLRHHSPDSPDDETILDCPVSYEDWYLEKEVEVDD